MPWLDQRVEFSDEQIIQLHKFCVKSGFVADLQRIAGNYKSWTLNNKCHSLAEAKTIINDIRNRASELKSLLTGLHGTEDPLLCLLQRGAEGYDAICRLEKDLLTLEKNSIFALQDLDTPEHSKAFKKRTWKRLHLAQTIETILLQYGLNPTGNRKGAWCISFKIVLEACQEFVSDPLNDIGELLKRRKYNLV